jgi:hypothetical protein
MAHPEQMLRCRGRAAFCGGFKYSIGSPSSRSFGGEPYQLLNQVK